MGLKRLHHVHIGVSDLAATLAFAADFGLVEAAERDGLVFLRGAGTAAYNLVLSNAETSRLNAIAFEADGHQDLERLLAFPGSHAIDALPGGGSAVELTDPEGLKVLVVTDIAAREADDIPPPMVINQGIEKSRRGVFQAKSPLGPAQLLRLGHVGLFVRDWRACDAWYREVLGLIPSDLMHAGPVENIIGGFYRLDRGDEYVDHHTLALFAMGRSDLHHLSFEVNNLEVQFMGHRWLEQRKHKPIWGVGRHSLGSHVFDVWRDPSGYRFETFSDTDVLNVSAPTAVHPVTDVAMDLWSDREIDHYFS